MKKLLFSIVIILALWCAYLNHTVENLNYRIDEAAEINYEVGFTEGQNDAVNTWLEGIQNIVLDEDGITIHIIDNNYEEYILYADGSVG